MLLIGGVRTLANVVIVNPTQVDLVSWDVISHGVATIVVLQEKDGFYHDRFPTDMFILLTIKVFRCLHQQADGFLHQCANMAWGTKGIGGSPLSILHTFYR